MKVYSIKELNKLPQNKIVWIEIFGNKITYPYRVYYGLRSGKSFVLSSINGEETLDMNDFDEKWRAWDEEPDWTAQDEMPWRVTRYSCHTCKKLFLSDDKYKYCPLCGQSLG